jgi:uncharacterized membrane protein YedE/YeeE
MMNAAQLPFLQPLLGGLLIGLASWLLLASVGRVAGISNITATAIAPANDEKSGIAWRWMFIAGLFIGGFMAAQWFAAPVQAMRPMWVLVAAGLLVGFGTVIGAGCTSGHGVCGLGRRSLRSLIATLSFMGAGMATVCIVQAITGKAML